VDEGRPIFLQIAELIENDIISGALPEETQVPSTNELAAFLRINPATAGKGVNRLVDDRRERFRDQYVAPLLAEAAKLGIDAQQLSRMIQETTAQEVRA
jgi:DNA-binding transcriptional regulator YhcF (GntR family)